MEPILTQRRASGTGIRDERKKETWPMQAPVQVPPPWVYRCIVLNSLAAEMNDLAAFCPVSGDQG